MRYTKWFGMAMVVVVMILLSSCGGTSDSLEGAGGVYENYDGGQ